MSTDIIRSFDDAERAATAMAASGFFQDSRSAAQAQKIRQAKLTPVAWSYLRLNDLTAEVAMVLAAFRDGYDGFIFDMEEGSKDKHAVAAQFAQTLVDRGVAPQ